MSVVAVFMGGLVEEVAIGARTIIVGKNMPVEVEVPLPVSGFPDATKVFFRRRFRRLATSTRRLRRRGRRGWCPLRPL